MGNWFFNLFVPWMALIIFLAAYIIAGSVDLVVTRLAVNERAKGFKAVSPGVLYPHNQRRIRCPLCANSGHQAPNHRHADFSIVVPAPIYFSAEKGVGVSIWLLMLATMGPSRSLSSRTLCQAGSFWNAVHLVSRSASDSHESM